MNCEICEQPLPEDYIRMAWELQRGYHLFYCVRCKHCIPEEAAVPGMPGWCIPHWDTRARGVQPGDFKPRSRSLQKKLHERDWADRFAALENWNKEQQKTTRTAQDILDMAAHRLGSKVENDPTKR